MRPRFPPSISSLRIAVELLFSVLVILTASHAVFAKSSFRVNPPQAWIRTIDFRADLTNEPTPAASSSSFLLDDHQTKVGEKTVDHYYHHVHRIETSAGLGDLSQLRFAFEPSYQQLAIHFIRIHRGQSLIDGLKPSEIKTVQQEEQLNQQLYNGTLRAIVFLNDLRVGDIVEYAFTVSGDNPVFGGRFAETFYVADQQPIEHLTLRLLWPLGRPLSVKNENTEIAPQVRELQGSVEYFWEARHTKAIVEDDYTPDWFNPYPTVTVSEFKAWSEVVQWALPLYASPKLSSPELISRIKKWQDDFESPEQRTLAALRFVQDEIRYLGIELGRYSHQPTSPGKVLARRSGIAKTNRYF